MLDLIITIGQTGCALILLYGAFLVLMPTRKAAAQSAALRQQIAHQDEILLHGHILYDV
jgi:hypothetical protein